MLEELDRRELGCHATLLQCERERERLEGLRSQLWSIEGFRVRVEHSVATSLSNLDQLRLRLEGELSATVALRASLGAVEQAAAPPETDAARQPALVLLAPLAPEETLTPGLGAAAAPEELSGDAVVNDAAGGEEKGLAWIEAQIADVRLWFPVSAWADLLELPKERVKRVLYHLHKVGRCARRPLAATADTGEEYEFGAVTLLSPTARAALRPFVPPRGSRVRRLP